MWKSMVQFRNKGFTLIELILGMNLIFILLITIFSLFNFSSKSLAIYEKKDNIFLNGQYGLDYIKSEVLTSDKIISVSKFPNLNERYPNNIGFVIMKEENKQFRYITYYIGDNKLVRLSCVGDSIKYPNGSSFSGFNQICTDILSFHDSNIDAKNKMLNLDIKMGINGDAKMIFKSDIYLRCILDL